MSISNSPEGHSRRHRRWTEHQEMHDLIERHRMIGALGQIIISEINLDRLFGLIVNQMTGLMHAQTCSVFLYDPETDELWSMVSSDLQKNKIRISARCGISGWVYSHQTPQIVNDPYDDPRFFKGVDRETGFRTQNILCIPLINRSKVCIGTLQVLNKKDGGFTEQDLEVFESASNYVTIALENAKLYKDLKALDRVKKKVIHHLSHELKTPLAILQGSFRIAHKRLNTDEFLKIEKSLDRGIRNLDRLNELQLKIDDILTNMSVAPEAQNDTPYSSLTDFIEQFEEESGIDSIKELKSYIQSMSSRPGNIRREMLDVGIELDNICETVRSVVDKRDLCLMRQFDHGASVYTDKAVFSKICSGLLKNAIENTPDEGSIEIVVKSNLDGVVIEFRDHGVGITEDNQSMVFSGFFPTQPTSAYSSKKPYDFNAGGAGVDLLRIKTFADRLNFHVEFESRRCPALLNTVQVCPGRISVCPVVTRRSDCLDQGGSTFVVRFPAALRQNR